MLWGDLCSGADINSRTFRGWTPLMASCLSNAVSVIRVLLDHSPTLDIFATNDGLRSNFSTLFSFTQMSADIIPSHPPHLPPPRWLGSQGHHPFLLCPKLTKSDRTSRTDGESCLHICAHYNNPDALKLVLSAVHDVASTPGV